MKILGVLSLSLLLGYQQLQAKDFDHVAKCVAQEEVALKAFEIFYDGDREAILVTDIEILEPRRRATPVSVLVEGDVMRVHPEEDYEAFRLINNRRNFVLNLHGAKFLCPKISW
jgi:hypothetical protein